MYVTEIWQWTYGSFCLESAIWQGIGKGPSIWQGMEKDQSYTWYMFIYTKYTLGLPLNISFTSVYAIIYQVHGRIQEYMTVYTRFTVVYKRLCRYILMTCKYILVHTIPEHCDVGQPIGRPKSTATYPSYSTYTLTSLYIPGMTTLILSICKYM
jgi:hypothetical protein